MSEWKLWEKITSDDEGDYTDRLRVPGGWIYCSRIHDAKVAMAMVFVPMAIVFREEEP